ncbi:protoheme IX farnesyltransferase [Bacilli bacterium]|nr:protoheme IX farnesyltransferase [Bacilli bacterium VT-13-104]PZD84067.1 protoheme IX farnesyltransferase [Bacilli bacterium]PZD86629.1 protoheme IX farnesyltransferase [Bacilli bacterium]PZD91402.1 protoheme IX farnesyltransferase [Bacilli bacterium]RCO06302.1 protoheme IX farnesyltransferase [Bacilli bacterium]
MNKAGAPYREIIQDSTVSTRQKFKTLITEIKALIKVGIINSNLITTFTGIWLAIYFTDSSLKYHWDVIALTLLGSALVIAGGCIVNNWFDVDIDPKMERTKNRPTVTGFFSLKSVLIIGLVTTTIGLLLLSFTTIEATLFAFFGWIVYVIFYTMWSKRKTTLNTIVGSFSGAMPPLIGWAAISPEFHIIPLVLFLIMFIWQTPHFLSLAMKKTEDYKEAGVPMLPVVYGFEITKRQIVIYTLCLLPLPFFMTSLGMVFVVISTLLNIGWIIIGFKGFFVKEDLKWANMMFIYSLNYLTIVFLLMIIVTLPIFN